MSAPPRHAHIAANAFCGLVADSASLPPTVKVVPPVTAIAAATHAARPAMTTSATPRRRTSGDGADARRCTRTAALPPRRGTAADDARRYTAAKKHWYTRW